MNENLNRRWSPKRWQMGSLVLLALWLTGPIQEDVEATNCNNDNYCQAEAGENCENCADCDCYCGDTLCTDGETCSGCEEDCASLCICGDGACQWPAEGEGGPVGNTCTDARSYYPWVECAYCPEDCGACDNDLCGAFYNESCQDDGDCGPCDDQHPCGAGFVCNSGRCDEVP